MGQKSSAGPLRESSGGIPTPLLVDTEQEFADLAAPDARQDLLLRQLRKKGRKQGNDFSGLDPPNVRQVEWRQIVESDMALLNCYDLRRQDPLLRGLQAGDNGLVRTGKYPLILT